MESGGDAKCLGGCTHYMQILDHFIPGCSHLQDQGVVTIPIESTPVVVFLNNTADQTDLLDKGLSITPPAGWTVCPEALKGRQDNFYFYDV